MNEGSILFEYVFVQERLRPFGTSFLMCFCLLVTIQAAFDDGQVCVKEREDYVLRCGKGTCTLPFLLSHTTKLYGV